MKKINLEQIVQASLLLLMVVIGVMLRFSSEIPNFTPMFAIALFSGYMFKNRILAFGTPLLIQLFSDYFIGFHQDIFAVYLSFGLISLLGYLNREKYSFKNSIVYSILSSVLFFIITNLSVWITSGYYTYSFSGLIEAYTMAIPFYRNTLISAILYSTIIFGAYSLFLNTKKESAII